MTTDKKAAKAAVEAVQKAAKPTETAQDIPGVVETAQTGAEAAQPAVQPVEEVRKPAEATLLQIAECAVTSSGGLRMRTAPSLTAPVLAVLPNGAGVLLDAPYDGKSEWVSVHTGTLVGWVKAQYLAPMLD